MDRVELVALCSEYGLGTYRGYTPVGKPSGRALRLHEALVVHTSDLGQQWDNVLVAVCVR